MATAKQYASQVYDGQLAIASKMGVTISAEGKPTRAVVKSSSIVMGVLMKLLVDKGLLTNAELSDAFAFVQADEYLDEPVDAPPPPP